MRCPGNQKRSGACPGAYEEVKAILEETGCLNDAHFVPPRFDDRYRRMEIQWLQDPEGDKDAAEYRHAWNRALLYLQAAGAKISENLKDWLVSEDEMLAKNSTNRFRHNRRSRRLPYLRE